MTRLITKECFSKAIQVQSMELKHQSLLSFTCHLWVFFCFPLLPYSSTQTSQIIYCWTIFTFISKTSTTSGRLISRGLQNYLGKPKATGNILHMLCIPHHFFKPLRPQHYLTSRVRRSRSPTS